MATTVAAVVAKARRDVMSHFFSRNAVTPASAVPYTPERRLSARLFAQLQDAGVLLPGAKGRGYYVDVAAWDSYSRKRRRRAGIAAAGAVAAIGALVALLA
ncbi:hypothetical protein [Sphingomonas sp.]|uniref:hypothetical protein n=1 Tax=Sphingomonas sp. TaxID=28214 RepID=UPI002BE776C2|nr:hypothetical protein [Sphingomonas sp.]HWK36640.1 hypothetical protein [Sphingomonas sp.]